MAALAEGGWAWVVVVLLGGACGVLASVATVWLLIRPGTAVRLGPVRVLPRGLLAGAFGSDRFRRDLGAALLASPGVQNGARGYLRQRAAELRVLSLGRALPAERRAEMLGRGVDAWSRLAARPDFEEALGTAVHQVLRRVAASQQHLRKYVPLNTAEVSIRIVEAAVPLVLGELEAALQKRANLERLYLAIREAADRYIAQQEGWKGSVARMLITDRAVGQATQWIVTTGFSRLAALLREPETQARLALALDDALARVLDRPINELAAGLAPERIHTVSQATAQRVLAALRDPALARRLGDGLGAGADRLRDRSLGELVGVRSAEQAERIADEASRRLFVVLCRDPAIRRTPTTVIWEAVRADLGWIVACAGVLAAALAALLFAFYNLG